MASVAMANNGGTTPSDQIRQMVNFILQEAHEKANEIRVKVRQNEQEKLSRETLLNDVNKRERVAVDMYALILPQF